MEAKQLDVGIGDILVSVSERTCLHLVIFGQIDGSRGLSEEYLPSHAAVTGAARKTTDLSPLGRDGFPGADRAASDTFDRIQRWEDR
jgi:hypothetical protein